MIEDIEAEMTESLEIKSKTDNLAVTEESDVDEAIPIYILKERKTKSYNKTMKTDIEKINTFEKINKLYTTQWSTIYEVI